MDLYLKIIDVDDITAARMVSEIANLVENEQTEQIIDIAGVKDKYVKPTLQFSYQKSQPVPSREPPTAFQRYMNSTTKE